MGEVKPVSIGSMKVGSFIVLEGAACKVTDIQVSKPGKHGHSKIRLTCVGILDDKKRIIVAPGHDNVETPIIEKKTAQVLSITGGVTSGLLSTQKLNAYSSTFSFPFASLHLTYKEKLPSFLNSGLPDSFSIFGSLIFCV